MALRIKLAISLLGVVLLVVAFQNCGAPIENGLLGGDTAAKAEKYADAPFAFKAEIDQLTYMSCSKASSSRSSDANANTYFTFKVGSYGSTGVQLTDEFYRYVNNKHYPVGVNKTNLKDSLVYSQRNNGATLQLAVRPRSNVRDGHLSASGSPTAGMDYVGLWPSMSTDIVASNFSQAQKGEKINYLIGGTGTSQRRMEGAVIFNSDSQLETDVRNSLRNSSYLTMTYSTPEGVSEVELAARASSHFDGTATQSVWGKAFQVDFQQADHRYSNNPNRVLRSVSEFDLEKDDGPVNSGKTWSCPERLRFMIVSPIDANDYTNSQDVPVLGKCYTAGGDQITNENRADFEVLRRHLRSEDWYINYDLRCVVPKKGDLCYSTQTAVQYDTQLECGPDKTQDCAHFVSVCLRN